LYYRLAVIQVKLPPLRERLEDMDTLAEGLLRSLEPHYPGQGDGFLSPASVAELRAHEWPGNVRELRNYLERCLALRARPAMSTDSPAADRAATLDDLADPSRPLKIARERWTRALERQYLEEMLRRHGDNVAAAARAADVDRMHFYRLLWRNGLR
jgi:DNA-binding NtrC family response regulator